MAAIALATPQLHTCQHQEEATGNRIGSKGGIPVHLCAALGLPKGPFGGAHRACLLHGKNRMVPSRGL